jgi:colanic acid/amylovoran biosynthesis glycosyltransferase
MDKYRFNSLEKLKLVLLPSLKAKKISDSQIIISKKLLDGINELQKYWAATIEVILEEDKLVSDNLDNITIHVDQLSFSVRLLNYQSAEFQRALDRGSVVLASVSHRQNKISFFCKQRNIPCIYVSEYSLKTRFQIINASFQNPFLKVRKYLWEIFQETRQVRAIGKAEGIQCNGSPTFNSYRKINVNPLLYFDSRVTEGMLIGHDELHKRTQVCLSKAKLRLVFSGRLLKMKGADHLIPTALHLRTLGVNFVMYICGDGELFNGIQEMIDKNYLSDSVIMKGVLKFQEELLPFVKNTSDLFICCHVQGDPSCTYLETMSCGVPIVGYANEAFTGVIKASGAGWATKMNRPDLLAIKIAELDSRRELLVVESEKSLAFASMHTFEKTFQNRISHIRGIAERAGL